MPTRFAHDDLKDQVRNAVDIVDLLGSYLELRREGRNFTALCPWHSDSRPSLKINPERQSWKCWVCDDGGDIFSFVMKRENVNFREALEMLADRAGIAFRQAKAAPVGGTSHKPTLFNVMKWAESVYHQCLLHAPQAAPARDYLRDRGIDESQWKRFHLGFAPGTWNWLTEQARSQTFGNELLIATGLLVHDQQKQRSYDRFRDRVMFSIRDPQDRPIAAGGRVLPGSDNNAKYINSPETRLFSKSEHLYALDLARDAIREHGHVIVVEGYTDVIMLHQHGVQNVVAALGTALGPRHVKVLRRYTDSVTLVLDGDTAGQRRSNEILGVFVSTPIDLRIVTLPEGQDPCDFVATHGADAFRQAVADADDALTYKVKVATRGLDANGDLHAINLAMEDILATLAKVQVAQQGQNNPWHLRMEQVLSQLARRFRVDINPLRQRLQSLRRAQRPISAETEPARDHQPLPRLQPWDRELLGLLFRCPELVEQATRRLGEHHLATNEARRIWNLLLEIQQQGQVPEFNRVLNQIEDRRLKNLMVEIDEAQITIPQKPQECLEQLIEAYHAREQEVQTRNQVAAIENAELSEEDAIAALTDILNQKRKRQGIQKPTDG